MTETSRDDLIEALREDIARTQASDILKLRSDINHLLQPIIGQLRWVEADRDDSLWREQLGHTIDRLRLALALMDEAATGEHADESHRARHGVGLNHYPSLAEREPLPTATDEENR